MTTGRSIWVLAVLWAGSPGLSGCHSASNDAAVARVAAPANTAVTAKPGPTPEQLTAGMVEAVAFGKSTLPITVKFDLPNRPVLGKPLEVVIALIPKVAAESATVQVTGGEGVLLGPNVVPVQITTLEPTQAYRVGVTLTPTIEGLQLLGVNISLKHDETTDTRSFSVPIIVAPSGDTAAVSAPSGKH